MREKTENPKTTLKETMKVSTDFSRRKKADSNTYFVKIINKTDEIIRKVKERIYNCFFRKNNDITLPLY